MLCALWKPTDREVRTVTTHILWLERSESDPLEDSEMVSQNHVHVCVIPEDLMLDDNRVHR